MSYLNNINNVFETTHYNEIQDNIVEWLDWGLLEKGNYFNSTLGELSPQNTDYSLLQLSNNPNFSAGQAWDGFRPNWVWQSGIPHSPNPIIESGNTSKPGVSGVYVDDTFYPTDTSGTYAHHIDYYNGRVVFDSPIPTGSKVQVEHSYKYINIIYANSLPWIREVSYDSLVNGRDPVMPPEMTIKLPCIAIEVSRRSMEPMALGGSQKINTDILFHCVADDAYTRNQMLDMVSYQNDKPIQLFNTNDVIDNDALPIDYYGTPTANALRYPDLISTYPLCKMYLRNMTVQSVNTINSNIYMGIVRATTEIYDLP